MSHPASPNGSHGSNGTAVAEDRRRREPRILCDRELSIMPLDGASARFSTAQLTDYSGHGLGLTLSEPVLEGRQVLVRMNLSKPVLLVYTLRYCIPTKSSQYRAGASFTGFAATSFQGEPQAIISALSGEG
jgi:hypothetical protein